MVRSIVARVLSVAGFLVAQSIVNTPAAAQVSMPTLASLLARDGYASVPFHWDADDHLLLDAHIDTSVVPLLLDSGFGGELELAKQAYDGLSGVHASKIQGNTGTAYGTESGMWGFADRVTLGGMVLGPLETYLLPDAGLTDHTELFGALALNSRGAIVDYVADSVYLLTGDSASPLLPTPTRSGPTLRTALEQSGQYRIFLDLMREAGLLSLLGDQSASRATTDSLAWRGLRLKGIDSAGAGALPATRERTLAARAGLSRVLRAPGRLTVFPPTDAAFARIPSETLRALRADRERLTRMLQAHLVPDTYLDTVALRTLVRGLGRPDGPTLGFHVLGHRIDVERLTDDMEGAVLARATVVQPELETADGKAVAHGIDRVLMPSDAPTPLATALAAQDYIAVTMLRLPNGMHAIRAVLDSVPVTLVLDTGCPYPLVLDLQRMGDHAMAQNAAVTFAAAGADLTVSMDLTAVDLTSVNDILQSQDVPPIDGIVGSRFLRRYGARLDYATGTLYLHKSPLPPR